MSRFAEAAFIAARLRPPFDRGGGALAAYDAVSLSVPVVQAMAAHAEPDLLVWGAVIPNLGWSNIAREIWLDAKLNPNVPAFSIVLACSTSMTATFAAAGMLGGGTDLTMVGGSEAMSRPSIALTTDASKRLTNLFAQDATAALAALHSQTPRDYMLPTKGWANRITCRMMCDHMEETAKPWRVSREAQDDWVLKSHQRAVAGWERGFFDDLVISLPELARDANPRTDTSPERHASLKPAFDRESGRGSENNDMQVIACHKFGAGEVLPFRGTPKPENKADGVQVSVLAPGMIQPDRYLHAGSKALLPEWRPFVAIPAVPGSDISGVVESITDYVDGSAPGEVVFGMIRFEGFSIASFRGGGPGRSAEQTYICRARLGKPMSATTPRSRRLRW